MIWIFGWIYDGRAMGMPEDGIPWYAVGRYVPLNLVVSWSVVPRKDFDMVPL